MFTDPDAPLVRLRWVFTDQPFLPLDTQSRILNNSLNLDNELPTTLGALPVGENNYVQDMRFTLPAFKLGAHMCRPELFTTGEDYAEALTLPPTVYLAGWIPECCVMPCDFEDCSRNDFQGAPASQLKTYPIAATDATTATPQFTIENDEALSTGGGNWPGLVMTYSPAGSAGGAQWYQYVLADPTGQGYEFERSLSLPSGQVIQEDWNVGGYDLHFNLNGASFDLRIRELGGQGQLTGTNLVLDPSIFPAGTGTVTSVGLSMPAGFTVTGSPVNSAGTLAVSTTLNGIVNADGSGFGVVTVGPGLAYVAPTLSLIETPPTFDQPGPTGTNKATAAPIIATDNVVGAHAANAGLVLPANTFGVWSTVSVNAGIIAASDMKLYAGPGSEEFYLPNGAGVGDTLTLAVGDVIVVRQTNPGRWTIIGWYNYHTPGVSQIAVTSWNGQTGAVTLTSGDVTTALGYTPGTSNFSGNFSDLAGIPTTLAGYGITDAQPLDADLTALAALAGTNTIYYRSGVSTWTAVTVGDYLDFTGGTLKAVPPTATSGQTVCSAFSITGATGVFQDSGNSIALPSAGTYLITGRLRATIQPSAAGGHFIKAKLRDNAGAADLANSETLVSFSSQNGVSSVETAGFTAVVTVGAATTYNLWCARNGTSWTTSTLDSDTNGRTVLDWVKLSN